MHVCMCAPPMQRYQQTGHTKQPTNHVSSNVSRHSAAGHLPQLACCNTVYYCIYVALASCHVRWSCFILFLIYVHKYECIWRVLSHLLPWWHPNLQPHTSAHQQAVLVKFDGVNGCMGMAAVEISFYFSIF